MSGKLLLLDTNIVVAIFNGDSVVINKLQKATKAFVPVIKIGELFFGAEKSGQKSKNYERLEAFCEISAILNCDTDTAREYGKIKEDLRAKGKPIPENDIWIAAIARQHNMVVVTRDNHFSHIEDLQTEFW